MPFALVGFGADLSARRPRRQGKADLLRYKGVSKDEIKVDYALAPFDRVARQMDVKWGIDRLVELVSFETSEKYGFSMGKLNEAIQSQNPQDANAWSAVCVRGLHAMDAEAERIGAPKSNPAVLEYDLDGWKIGIHPDVGDWPAVRAARPDLTLFTLREAAVALRDLRHPMVAAVKAEFPGAEVTKIGRENLPKEFYKNGGDEIPW